MKFEPVYLVDFADRILIHCPNCDLCAVKINPEESLQKRIVCRHCGLVTKYKAMYAANEKLWLETNCCGERLWAYNEKHLDFLESFVSEKIRECLPDPEWGIRNSSLQSRLPQWMLAGKNREKVLNGLQKLRKMLPEKKP